MKPNKVRLLVKLSLGRDLVSAKVNRSLDVISTNSRPLKQRTWSHCTVSGSEVVQCNELLSEVVGDEEVEG